MAAHPSPSDRSSPESADSTPDLSKPARPSSSNVNSIPSASESSPGIGPEFPASTMSEMSVWRLSGDYEEPVLIEDEVPMLAANPMSDRVPFLAESTASWEARTFDWQASSANDESWRGKGRAWIEHKPGEVGALQTTKVWALWWEPLISSAVDSHAKTSASQDAEPDSQANDPASSSSSPGAPMNLFDQEDSSSSRTYPDFFPPTTDEISPSFSRRWPNSGFTTSPTECWTVDISECPSDGGVSTSLPDVLVEASAPRFFLSPTAAAGILRRAGKRGRPLPEHLDAALSLRASQRPSPEDPPPAKECLSPDADRKTTTTSSADPSPPGTERGSTPPSMTEPSSPESQLTMDDPSATSSTTERSSSPSRPGSEPAGPTSPTPKPDGSSEPVAIENIGRKMSGGPEVGMGIKDDGTMYTLDKAGRHGVFEPMAVSENQRGEVLETPYTHQLTTGGGKPGQGYPAVRTPPTTWEQGGAVRRLTPTECERLQGFPDGWTMLPLASIT